MLSRPMISENLLAKESPIPTNNNYYDNNSLNLIFAKIAILDDRQISHLICARLKHDLYDFLRGVFWACFLFLSCIKGLKTPPEKVI